MIPLRWYQFSSLVTFAQLKGQRIYFGSCFERFHLTILDSIDSGPMVRENIKVAGVCGRGGC
jgi:hypothetical protein